MIRFIIVAITVIGFLILSIPILLIEWIIGKFSPKTKEEKEDYFHHFLENKPVGKIDYSHIEIGCNTASDAGIYTFTYGTTGKKVQARYSFNYQWDGKNWLISQHHSSAMPEKQ